MITITELVEIAEDALRITRGEILDPRSSQLISLPISKPGSEYYIFLFLITQKLKPMVVIELGTGYGAVSGQHLAAGYHEASVFTVDISDVTMATYYHSMPNLHIVTNNSLNIVGSYKDIDVLFIDSEHTYEQVSDEFKKFLPYVRKGGLVLFDDINLGEQMTRFWSEVQQPKVDLPIHNNCGFGAYIKIG